MKRERIFLIIIVSLISIIALIGASFAWVTVKREGTVNVKTELETANLGTVTFLNGNVAEAVGTNIYPGWKNEDISFIVIGSNISEPIEYTITATVTGSPTLASGLKYNMSCTSTRPEEGICVEEVTTAPFITTQYIGTLAPGNDTHTYTVSMEFPETNTNQNIYQNQYYKVEFSVILTNPDNKYSSASVNVNVNNDEHVKNVTINGCNSSNTNSFKCIYKTNATVIPQFNTGYELDTISSNDTDINVDKFKVDFNDININIKSKPITYNVVFNSNTGNGSMAKETFTYDTKGKLNLNTFTKDNYVFNYWNTKADGTGTRYNDGDEILNLLSEKDDEIVLYAQWIEKEYAFDYIGSGTEFVTPKTGTYKLEVWGAQGGGNGGYGGYSVGNISLTEGKKIYVYVGGRGGRTAGGYNGGGNGQQQAGSINPAAYGGGGATHIAFANDILRNLSTQQNQIIIVAGAGGGGGENGSWGGAGGGTTGNNGSGSCYVSTGGTQTGGGLRGDNDASNGGFGYGGNAPSGSSKSGTYGAGGGGAGYYGGGGSSFKSGSSCAGGGAGGSGYVNTSYLTNTSMTNGVRAGNGYAKITYIEK